MRRHLTTTIRLAFPNIGREFVYMFPYDLARQAELRRMAEEIMDKTK